MSKRKSKIGLKKLRSSRRRTGPSEPVHVEDGIVDEKGFPALLLAHSESLDVVDWAVAHRDRIEELLRHHGGVLLRGFEPLEPAGLERLVHAVSERTLEYHDQATPRSRVEGNIYTSTEYAADQVIELHNESVYSDVWPRKIFFLCDQPSVKGGETPVADCRGVLQRLPDELVDEFRRRRLLYVRNFGEGLGLPWQKVFGTDDPRELEGWCTEHGIEVDWKGDGRLATRQRRDALARHPVTGDLVWLNQAVAFHVSTLSPTVRTALLAEYGHGGVPKNVLFGDGEPIGDDVLEVVRRAYEEETVVFPWLRGDVLILDNVRLAHGRRPYEGPRRIVVGMSEPCRWQEVRA